MPETSCLYRFAYGNGSATVYEDIQSMGRAAADFAAARMREALQEKDVIRIMIGTGNSQESTIAALVADPKLDWDRIEVFHMDEYIGIPSTHPASFRRWLRSRVDEKARPRAMHYLDGDALDLEREIARYSTLLLEKDMDLSFIGFGENGHIAFNDPHVADFADPAIVKRVDLDEACRLQQVGEGHFSSLTEVPTHALTVTCSGLLRARHLVVVVPERRKAAAVKAALLGPLTTKCPASIVRTHPAANLFLDRDSAELLTLS